MTNIVVVTKQGAIIKFDSNELNEQHRGGRGVKAVELSPKDEVVSAFAIEDRHVPQR